MANVLDVVVGSCACSVATCPKGMCMLSWTLAFWIAAETDSAILVTTDDGTVLERFYMGEQPWYAEQLGVTHNYCGIRSRCSMTRLGGI